MIPFAFLYRPSDTSLWWFWLYFSYVWSFRSKRKHFHANGWSSVAYVNDMSEMLDELFGREVRVPGPLPLLLFLVNIRLTSFHEFHLLKRSSPLSPSRHLIILTGRSIRLSRSSSEPKESSSSLLPPPGLLPEARFGSLGVSSFAGSSTHWGLLRWKTVAGGGITSLDSEQEIFWAQVEDATRCLATPVFSIIFMTDSPR